MKELYLIFFSIIGFLVSVYILYSKKFNKPLYCPIGENCDEVVRSKYGKTFGVDNTIPGMAYFAMIFIYAMGLASNRRRSKSPNKNKKILWAIALQYISALWAENLVELKLAPNFLFIAENTDSAISLRL